MMKVCGVYEMKFGPNLFTKARGSRYKKIGLVPTWKGHATCGKFFKTLLVKRPLRKLPM